MAYPLIITGAGASYDMLDHTNYSGNDSIPLNKWRPPLTNQLFDGTRFNEVFSKYPEMHRMAAVLRGKIKDDSSASLESELTRMFTEDTGKNPELFKSFIAFQFYMVDLFSRVSNNYYRPVNNYDALLYELSVHGGKAVFVDFNYDTLLEQAVHWKQLSNVNELVSHPDYPIIKVHGSYDWFYELTIYVQQSDRTSYPIAIQTAEKIMKREITLDANSILISRPDDPKNMPVRIVDEDLDTAKVHYPAIALPLTDKNSFVCPSSHIQFLESSLNKVDRILVIGWKVGDKVMADKISALLSKKAITIAFVGGSNSEDIINELPQHIRDNVKYVDSEGFTHFVNSTSLTNFLSE